MSLSLFNSILLLFSLLLASPTSQLQLHEKHHHQRHGSGLKSLRFTLYVHETFNKTAYFIVKGVTGSSGITTTSNPFGSLFAFNDPLNETPDPSSKVIGYTEGSSVTSSFDGERTTGISRITLNLKGYKGELLNVGTAHYTQVSELPFIGGTGDFRFVQGYMTTSVVDLSAPTTCYKLDFNLFWPPYAALAHY
ncbi:dirigent protein 1-like [Chenopodium quinoa]|uniref:dirigent protein 1-like n=1 Tax=Chenopodium quinoa TaxID=63459 RepID=UPI000B792E35|nr:dirigent protein 1-like [Chenopodium quinoa]